MEALQGKVLQVVLLKSQIKRLFCYIISYYWINKMDYIKCIF